MKKVTIAMSFMAAMVLTTSASAKTIVGGPASNDLCHLVNVETVSEFGDKAMTSKPFLYTISKISTEEAGAIIVKIVESNGGYLKKNQGCDGGCKINVTSMIDGRLGYLGGLGQMYNSTFELSNEIGARGAIKKTVNINLAVLAKK